MKRLLIALLLGMCITNMQAYSRVNILKHILLSKRMNLRKKKCVPCEGRTIPFTQAQIDEILPLVPEWAFNVGEVNKIVREYTFKDFKQAMAFCNKVALIAENEGHHPVITIQYNKVKLELYTFAIRGLAENDFIMAAKIDELDSHEQKNT